MARMKAPTGMRGERALIVRVIALAKRDALKGTKDQQDDAIRYLRSSEYKKHLQILKLPTDWLPTDEEY